MSAIYAWLLPEVTPTTIVTEICTACEQPSQWLIVTHNDLVTYSGSQYCTVSLSAIDDL